MFIRVLILTLLILVIDFYVFQAFKFAFRNTTEQSQKIINYVYWSFTAFSLLILMATLVYDFQLWPKAFRTYASAFIFVMMISKLFVVIFLLTDDVFRVFKWAFVKFFGTPALVSTPGADVAENSITRSDFLIKTGLVLASIPFFSLLWGMAKGAYDYQVKIVKLKLPNLPKVFEGYRIVQISDIHTGSFVDTEPLKKAVKMINDLNPDILFFTGDLVNNRHEEAIPHFPQLSLLKAKHGVYSILGNHDYGDYVQWNSELEKRKNLNDLIQVHKDLGWDILLDEHRIIEHEGDSITLIGVQNWSTHLRFPKYGSMEKATENIKYSDVNILLSHDPSHWNGEILSKYPRIDLMLAGHTHGMQFGIDLPFLKWSPVQYVYKQWAGLYTQGKQHLYVNRGLGFLGYPGRVGILPEITVLELHSA